ncbi:class I SAM-dependent DNA methyltransferase [Planococcus lenghuensis]|uniref:SAM-dependent methyltransferase n=1 Tax=Planococcus lenghuensis TaxID=2213202 RepID=A0A1Q2KVE0_9BACL|nr:class I SAM-dependent methyltransferase [Planococcus lenghuensis]AQQ52188.1 SAM-dependent methyltransferase [Planococcus lenghuensis]
MSGNGSSFYEKDEFFTAFLSRRSREESPNNTMEEPVILDLIGDVTGQRVLDLGCGDGRFGSTLFERGCRHYDGIDGSANMVKMAIETLYGTASTVRQINLEDWTASDEAYDLIVSRMVFHYLPDVRQLFKDIYASLSAGGQFVFSVQHPVLTSSPESAEESGRRGSWLVDDYFKTGRRVEPWIDEEVVKYHRTTDDYFTALTEAGFAVESLKECAPQLMHFSTRGEFHRRQRIPLFLVFSCRK